MAKAALLSSYAEAALPLIETLLATSKPEEDLATVGSVEEIVKKPFQTKWLLYVERHKTHAMVQVPAKYHLCSYKDEGSGQQV